MADPRTPPKVSDGADLGARVRLLRERRAISLRELARRAGVQVSDVSRLERGITRQPRLTLALALADGLEVTLSHLLGEDEDGGAGVHESPSVVELRLALDAIGREAERVARIAARASAMLGG